jgi:hypothetical protein
LSQKTGWATFWPIVFTNSSGHPAANAANAAVAAPPIFDVVKCRNDWHCKDSKSTLAKIKAFDVRDETKVPGDGFLTPAKTFFSFLYHFLKEVARGGEQTRGLSISFIFFFSPLYR